VNICHVITRLIIGGAQENTVLTCRGLVERGHRVTLVAGPETGPEGSLWDQARDSGCELISLHNLCRAVHPVRDLKARRDLVSVFRSIGPDVVHTHSSKAGILGRSAAAAACVPVVVHTIHGMSFNRTQPVVVQWLYRGLERRAARQTHALVGVADSMIEQSVAAGIAPRHRFAVIRSGVETDRFAPRPDLRARHRSEWGLSTDEVVVGTVARLFENKGYDEIITAMPAMLAQSPRLRFVWVGDGKHRADYEDRLRRMGIRDRVLFLGLLPPEQVATVLNGFDIVLHASRWEGLPRAVVQGLLTGVPAVSFDNDGAPEVVIPGETGILVPYGDTSRLAAAVSQLAEGSALRTQLGAAGRARCLVEFDWRTMVAQIEALYERLTRRGEVTEPRA
jgi:glycosyltransferase involved in cell wall biosynthesis